MPAKKSDAAPEQIRNFEQSIADLEAIVKAMESGDLSLEQSMQQFEQGIQLVKSCHDTLAQAELKVEQLIEKNGLLTREPFDDANG